MDYEPLSDPEPPRQTTGYSESSNQPATITDTYDKDEKIDAYINSAFPTWSCNYPEDQEGRQLGHHDSGVRDKLPNCRVKGGTITDASWEPYVWLFDNLRWSAEPSGKNEGTSYQELAILFKLAYGNYDGRNYDVEVETRLMRTALHKHYAKELKPTIDGQQCKTQEILCKTQRHQGTALLRSRTNWTNWTQMLA